MALLREHFDETVSNVEDLETQLGISVLGELDIVDTKVRKRMLKVKKKRMELDITKKKGGELRA